MKRNDTDTGRPEMPRLKEGIWIVPVLAGMAVGLGGCAGTPTVGEVAAREDVKVVKRVYRPSGERPPLPELTPESPLGEYLHYAMLNRPRVEVAYYEWVTAVAAITPARSLPDPRLTFQTDISSTVASVMPGLMQQFPGPGKLAARAEVATAASRARYFAFESSVLQTAFAVKRAYYRRWFLEEKIRLNREMLRLVTDLEKVARAKNAVGRVTLQDVYRAQIEQARISTEIANLEDSRLLLRAQFKASLGLRTGQAEPPFPAKFETTTLALAPDKLLAEAFARNPKLRALAEEVSMAQAALGLAHKAKMPDFHAGLMVDTKMAPLMFRPGVGMTLPIWRDKIAAEIAGAQATRRAADARLSDGQIRLSVDFAERSFQYREAGRNLALLQDQLIPKAQLSLKVARAGYLAGKTDFFNLIDAERTLLGFQLADIGARTQRELVLADISLLIQGVTPVNAPLLPRPKTPANPQP